MNFAARQLSILGVLTLMFLAAVAAAQDTTNRAIAMPPLPMAKSPVDAFRELLAMEPAAQRAALSNRTEQARVRLVAKIREYKAMDPDDCELRLVATELRWYLPQLMAMPATNRTAWLASIRSDDLRKLIESRLARWEALDADLRGQYLQNEQAFALLVQSGSASKRLRQQLINEVSPEMRATLNRALARLDAMDAAERARAFDVFENIFTMTPIEKDRALRVMSTAEKAQMEKTLATFGKLPIEQRKRCIVAYEKFASMPPTDRALFYRNVQQWEKMSAKERQEWRDVVRNVEILPPVPGFKPSPPPLPPTVVPRAATNRT